jgi:DNA-binding XRE family transcriptional regulator
MGDLLGLESVDPELLELMNLAHNSEQRHDRGKAQKTNRNGSPLTIEGLKADLGTAIMEHKVTELLKAARQQSGQSLADAAQGMAVSRGRIQAIEKSENLEIATLLKYVGALGYDVVFTLVPKNKQGQTLGAYLSSG